MNEPIHSQIQDAARVLFQAGEVVEVRVPKAGKLRTIAGYFDDWTLLAESVSKLDFARYPGVYWTLNPVDPALLARGVNRTQGYAGSGDLTSDDNILRRHWLPIDLDPKRPSGISSTEAQHEAALALARHVQSELIHDGWPEAVYADSGNGAHLLYRVDLPNDRESKELLSRVLQGLAARFDTREAEVLVEVDQTMFNASRIIKIYGTTARKGDPTPERPHRVSRLLEVPGLIAPVPLALLQAQAVVMPERPAARDFTPYRGPRGQEFNLEEFLSRFGIRYRAKLPYQGGWKYQLEECPWNPAHKAPDSVVYDYPDGYGFHCSHNSCAGRDWREFRELFEGPKRVYSPGSSPGPRLVPPPPLDGDVPPNAQPLEPSVLAGGVSGDVTGQNPPSAPPAEEGEAEADGPPPGLLDYPMTDSGNGERIVAMFGANIRYCTEMKSWFIWDGRRWALDRENRMRHKANEMARELYRQGLALPEGARRTSMDRHARASESSKGITNALSEAERMPGVPVTAQMLDQQSDRLNFLNGTVCLRDGSVRKHDPADLITKLCEHNYNPQAKAPLFQVFVEWAMGGPVDGNPDAELSEMTVRLVQFIQRVIGYSITGEVTEKCVFVFYGADGDNGKTTLLTLFRVLLGRDYASLLLIETIMHARSTDNTAREDMADLRGTRFVQTSEISKEDRLNEQRVKFLTQGMGTIKSRRLHEHLIEFTATHKLLMDCNYRPKVSGQDNAIWRRLIQIPFNVTISEDRKDPELSNKLQAEAEGILAWAVRGSIEWYKNRLGKPPEVAEAQADWREHDDPVREFLSDWCEVGEGKTCTVADLMTAYLSWAKEYGEKFPLARRAFNEAMTAKGIKQGRDHSGRFWTGVELQSFAAGKLRGPQNYLPD